MTKTDPRILRCPVTGEDLIEADEKTIVAYSERLSEMLGRTGKVQRGFTNRNGSYFYPELEGIILCLPHYAIFTGKGEDKRDPMKFDKKRVFEYYNELGYQVQNGMTVYNDTGKWVDYRQVSERYIRTCFKRAGKKS